VDYWDTSALLKLYCHEPDSTWFLDFVRRSNQPATSSAIAATELACALCRKEREGDLKRGGATALLRQFQEDCAAGRVLLMPCGFDVIAETQRLLALASRNPDAVLIRSLDLIHLASASLGRATVVLATDKRLCSLAMKLGFELRP
jgi:predicted nucleic acid-binding protein